MRSFSTFTNVTIQTYDINCSEYCQDVSGVYAKAVNSFADALEVGRDTVRNCISHYVTDGAADDPYWTRVTSSEVNAIVRFTEFLLSVRNREVSKDPSGLGGHKTRVFFYACLNTGKTFTWVDFIG